MQNGAEDDGGIAHRRYGKTDLKVVDSRLTG
ncbi:hypothetical protein PTE30175_02211 [Pandoraea terrae]|uniref:Uncharacterized protein n=1 Tax=Pandoraea terrae TaxID=1537710 RepID=A0A5E4UX34_9BURK|nr:hypothetical protein PTE30175_02211 [Pandoraea terrae]